MSGQPEIHAVPDIGEFGMMIDLLRVQRDAGEEGESLRKILEAVTPLQRLAVVAGRPAVGNVHMAALRLAKPACQAQMGGRKGVTLRWLPPLPSSSARWALRIRWAPTASNSS